MSEAAAMELPANSSMGQQNLTNVSIDFCHGIHDLSTNICYVDFFAFPLHQDEHFWPTIYGTVFPILLVLTIVANIFVVLVLSKPHMRTPTNTVLLYMAIADVFVGLVPFPFTFYYYTMQTYLQPTRRMEACLMYQYLMDALPPICHNIAMWLTVLLAVQRYIYIAYPLWARTFCTVQRVRTASALIVVLSIICGFPKFFEFTFHVFNGPVTFPKARPDGVGFELVTTNLSSCAGRFQRMVIAIGVNNFYNMFYWTRVVVFIVVPSFLLILLNALLIRGIHLAQIRKQRLLQQNRRREAHRQNESNTTSLMLVLIVTVFLVVNLPQGIFLAIVCVDSTFELGFLAKVKSFGMIFLPLDNMLILATYPLNFAIYCSLSSQFRETFKRLFCHHLPPMPHSSWSTRLISQMSRRSISLGFSSSFKRRRSKLEPRNGDMAGEYSLASPSQTCADGVSIGKERLEKDHKESVTFHEPSLSVSFSDEKRKKSSGVSKSSAELSRSHSGKNSSLSPASPSPNPAGVADRRKAGNGAKDVCLLPGGPQESEETDLLLVESPGDTSGTSPSDETPKGEKATPFFPPINHGLVHSRVTVL